MTKILNDKIHDYEYDFAISYAGEDVDIANKIKKSIREISGDYSVFLASDEQVTLVGLDGEIFFQELFKYSKQVIVLFSENYKRKDWARYELAVIQQRDENNRFIPIKLDDVNIIGLRPSTIYIPFSNNSDYIADIAVKKLLHFEYTNGIQRETELQKFTRELKNSKGTLDKSYQLVRDDRTRTPLEDIPYPDGDFQPSYTINECNKLPFGKISRISLKINLPADLSREVVKYNLKYCVASVFNEYKPAALKILAYSDQASNFQGFNKYNVASCDFAPWGDFGKAEDGFAFNVPVSKFDHTIQFEESYFDKNIKMITDLEYVKNITFEMFDEGILEIIRNSEGVNTSKILKKKKAINPDILRERLKILKEKKLIKKVGPSYNWHWEIVNK